MDRANDNIPRAGAPTRVIQPVVVPAQFFVVGPILAAIPSIVVGFFTFLISNAVANSIEPMVGPGLAGFALCFAAILALIGHKAFHGPGLTRYAIYPDRIELEEGIFNRRRRTILLDRIIDVQLAEGILQRTVGAGTITLATQQLVNQGDGRLSNRTFQLTNVSDPVGVYELIRSLALGGRGTKSVIEE